LEQVFWELVYPFRISHLVELFSLLTFSQLGTFKDVNGEIKNKDLLEKSIKNRRHQSLEEQGGSF